MKKFLAFILVLLNTITFVIGLGFLFGEDEESKKNVH